MSDDLTDEERQFITDMRAGKSIIINCNFNFGVGVREDDDGRAEFHVVEDIVGRGYDGPAVRDFASRIVARWSMALQASKHLH